MILICCFPLAASPQDVVVIRNPDGSTTRRAGNVKDWTGNKLTLVDNRRERSLDGTSVVEIRSQWPAELLDARRLVGEHKFPEAIVRYRAALQAERRNWVQQIITAELIQALDATESYSPAISHFIRLFQSDPQTRFFYLIPLRWTSSGLQAPSAPEIQRWLDSTEPVLQLLGASWGLAEAQSLRAKQVLHELAQTDDQRIAQLATTQLWRSELLTAQPRDADRWQRQIDHLESMLRAGPLALLGEAQYRSHRLSDAQITFMKIPILYPERRSLAAYALFRSGEIHAEKSVADSHNQAPNLFWFELIREHPFSEHAAIAKSRM